MSRETKQAPNENGWPLVIRMYPEGSSVCSLCGKDFVRGSELTLCVPVPDEPDEPVPVCLQCGHQYAPELAAFLYLHWQR